MAGDGEVERREEDVEVEVGEARARGLVEQPALRGGRANSDDEEHTAHRSSGDEERGGVEDHSSGGWVGQNAEDDAKEEPRGRRAKFVADWGQYCAEFIRRDARVSPAPLAIRDD